MDLRRFIGQSVHSGVFFVLGYASRLLLAIALGKSLTTQEYGVYSLIGAVLGMSTSLLPLGVSQYFMREVPGIPASRAATIFKSVVGIQLITMGCLFGVTLTLPWSRAWLTHRLGLPAESGLILLISALILVETLASDFARFLFSRKEIERGNIVAFFQTGCWAYAAFALFAVKPTAVNLTTVLALWCASLVLAIVYGGWRSNLRVLMVAPFQPSVYVTALGFALPLLSSQFLAVVNWLGRFLIAGTYSTTAVGIYTYHYNVVLMIAAISSPLIGTPLDPYVVEAYNTGQHQRSGYLLGAAMRYRLLLVIPLLVVAGMWSDVLIRSMARSDYAAGHLLALLTPVPILMIVSSTFERVLFLERRTPITGRCYLYAAAVQLVLYLMLVPWHPYFGPAVATEGGLAALALLLWYHARSAAVTIETALGRVALAGVLCLGVAWVLAKIIPPLPRLLFLTVVTTVVGASYLLFAYLFRVILEPERRLFVDAIRGGCKLLWSLRVGGSSHVQ